MKCSTQLLKQPCISVVFVVFVSRTTLEGSKACSVASKACALQLDCLVSAKTANHTYMDKTDVHVEINTDTDTYTHTQTYRHSHSHRDIHRHRHKHTQTHRHTHTSIPQMIRNTSSEPLMQADQVKAHSQHPNGIIFIVRTQTIHANGKTEPQNTQ